ncbi:hypothetical protein [Lysinibacillus sp. 54212]|uniref:hypothetical protein n=1 Tax=Lysinibacillus sp. 54212 TaxID=3119829 RepID=UPI002FC8CC63
MVQVYCNEDCGNAPKKKLCLDFLKAVAEGRTDEAITFCIPEITVDMIGRESIQGQERLQQFLQQIPSVEALHIHRLITHGKEAAVNGEVKTAQGSHSLALFFTFNAYKNAFIKKLVVYLVL